MCENEYAIKDLTMSDVAGRLLVGAPRARALARQNANITGGLYNCDITSPSHDCERVEFDNEGECSPSSVLLTVTPSWFSLHVLMKRCIYTADVLVENKENQWMGVTVQSQGPGGKIVVSDGLCPLSRCPPKSINWQGSVIHINRHSFCISRVTMVTIWQAYSDVSWCDEMVFCLCRLVPTATRGGFLGTRAKSRVTSSAAATSWVRTWPSTPNPMRTGGTGSSVRAEREAMRDSGRASRVSLLPLLKTTTIWSLGPQEPTTGKVGMLPRVWMCLTQRDHKATLPIYSRIFVFILFLA